MTDISVAQIKELRDRTSAGMMDCKKALQESEGDIEKAIDWLRKKGIANADKKAGRIATEGIIDSYIHNGSRVGVLIEVNIETDFAARNEDFKEMVHNICLQICSMNPHWVSRDEVPEDVIERESAIAREKAKAEGKPDKILDKIVEGRLNKFYEENCLLEQEYFLDETKNIETLVKEMIAKIGENIQIRRFTRYELGEGLQKKEDDFAAEVEKQLKHED